MIESDVLKTTDMLLEVFEKRGKYVTADLAFSVHAYLARGLAELAVEKALENGVKTVGFSGGVACNEIFTKLIREVIEGARLNFLVHEAVPPGDGGLSFGQAVYVGLLDFKT
jgi:hydrogenase maturation protein HypF